ncbi:hypothetical protein BU23DRAFT_584006 [Bimuria novae-zelandiae CBS 107.79]|uniref:DUF8021 domain-containing protein n=1 Tax=Bimuria novae-zelandiae CBS 107.79 TaxID=1447943 RepID=A0A6A5UR34_9PLEO|nr:hypothetical protein BU23DRAFT_584006 [Bimuria novae-zelandiae CBS 107.79]
MFLKVLFSVLTLVSVTWAACDRATLQAATAALVKAQTSGNTAILPITVNTTYMENDTPLALTSGVLTQAMKIDLTLSLHDTTHCATFTEMIAASAAHPYVLMTRMLFSSNGSTITRIENVVADAGDWLFNAKGSLSNAKKESWGAVDAAKRDSREVIKAAGDAYLDSWADGKVKVPYGSPCARLEGGSYTTNCKMPVFPQEFISAGGAKNRRYIIDEEVGAVDIFNDFPFLDKMKPNGTASTNLVRVESGLIRYIHEVTICTNKNCGR